MTLDAKTFTWQIGGVHVSLFLLRLILTFRGSSLQIRINSHSSLKRQCLEYKNSCFSGTTFCFYFKNNTRLLFCNAQFSINIIVLVLSSLMRNNIETKKYGSLFF